MSDQSERPKIFVLDTSVILYDFQALDHFEEHDVGVPITVLEELDHFKKGNSVINLHAREFIRHLDRLSENHDLREWIPLNGPERGRFRILTNEHHEADAAEVFGSQKNDHRILNAALRCRDHEPGRRVILVTKDINLRVKARSVGLRSEDYETVRIQNVDLLYKGMSELETTDDVVQELHSSERIPLTRATADELPNNHYLILRGPRMSALAYLNPKDHHLERLAKSPAYGIVPRNAEQTFALHAILNPNVPLVSLSGSAGTGKTLLALAGALEQRRRYRQVYLTRPVVPLANKDMGYLPGDMQMKISPYMQPLWDNLGVIKSQFTDQAPDAKRIDEMVEQEKLQIVPLAYIRGRSFANIIFIVDEAQNLTPHEVKTIITRAGEGTKIVLTGDIFQIDTPYLDAHSNGLSYLIDRLKGSALYAHVSLAKGERSELANLASKLL